MKERKSFSEIVTFLSNELKVDLEKKGEELTSPKKVLVKIIIFFLFAMYLLFYEDIESRSLSLLIVDFVLASILLTIAIAGLIKVEETRVYPKAFWFWISGKDPETS